MRIGGKAAPSILKGSDASITGNAMISMIENINRQNITRDAVKSFKIWDKDKSNDLNFTEFLRMAKNIPVLQLKDEHVLREMFESIDIDENGTLSIPEFRNLWHDLPDLKKITMVPYPGMKLCQLKGCAYLRQWLYYTLDTYDTRMGWYIG